MLESQRWEARGSVASRANRRILLGCALLCGAALLCSGLTFVSAEEQATPAATTAPAYPIASDARLAGDSKQTRFILDLDKTIQFRAFALSDPYRLVIDIPQVDFRLPPGTGIAGRGLIKAFRYGLVMPGGSRIVFDLSGPARVANSYMLDQANGQPPRLVIELEQVDSAAFVQTPQQPDSHPGPKLVLPAITTAITAPETKPAAPPETKPVAAPETRSIAATEAKPAAPGPAPLPDTRPVVVIDPGHGGIDNGTQTDTEAEKNLVLEFGLALRDRIEKNGKYRVVMTRTDDTFIPLGDRVKIARSQSAALFVSIHADALPKGEGDAQGATIYTLSDKASDAEAQRLADAENRADAIGGVNLTDEPTDVADILIDLVQRETRTFSNRFARVLMGEMKTTA